MRGKILQLIAKNSKLTPEEIAKEINADPQQVAKEIKLMEENRVICGYNTLINYDNTDRELVTALIEVKVTPQRGDGYDKIAERIYRFDEVKAVYLMSGGFDLTVILEKSSLKEIALFVSDKLATIDSVTSTATHFVLKKYKDHGTVLCDGPQDERMMIVP